GRRSSRRCHLKAMTSVGLGGTRLSYCGGESRSDVGSTKEAIRRGGIAGAASLTRGFQIGGGSCVRSGPPCRPWRRSEIALAVHSREPRLAIAFATPVDGVIRVQ